MSEAIFCHKDGSPIHSFKKGFNALIKEAGVEFDSNGQRRVIYSLRHTYATFRLHEGVVVPQPTKLDTPNPIQGIRSWHLADVDADAEHFCFRV